MSTEEIPLDPELTAEQMELVSKLSNEQLEEIDAALLFVVGEHYRKVAMVIAMAMENLENRVEGIPDTFYSTRVAWLVLEGKLVSQGDLRSMRYSEVKTP